MFRSYSQNAEDVVLWRALKDVVEGCYVDVGAADPVVDSVTKAFYDRGWSGIDVEPTAAYAAALRDDRPRDAVVQACAGDAPGSLTLHEVIGTGLSTVTDDVDRVDTERYEVVDVEVPVVVLDDLLEEHGCEGRDIHFLKVDVEGFEEQVLRGVSLARWRPWIVVIEATLPNSTVQVHDRWEHLLTDAGYQFCLFDGLNRFYSSPDHPELVEILSFPVCVFDEPYVRRPHGDLLDEYENLAEGNSRLQELYEQAIAEHGKVEQLWKRAVDDFEQLNERHLATLADFERLEGIHRSTVGDYERVEGLYHRAVGDYERVDGELRDALARVAAHAEELRLLGEERDVLRQGVARMSAEYDELRAARDRANHELDLMRHTVSWRVTRPLRGVRRRIAR
ncbi:MAG: FkbM family methyltransferase [Ilumatobacteraceae bacterium]